MARQKSPSVEQDEWAGTVVGHGNARTPSQIKNRQRTVAKVCSTRLQQCRVHANRVRTRISQATYYVGNIDAWQQQGAARKRVGASEIETSRYRPAGLTESSPVQFNGASRQL